MPTKGKKNIGILKMSKGKMPDFAKTKEKALPKKHKKLSTSEYIKKRNVQQYGA